MEYPILPGSALPNDVVSVGQRIVPTHGLDRPNVVERQAQYIDSIPMQHPNAYHQLPFGVQAAVPAQQTVLVRQAVQSVAPAPTYIPVHVPSTRAKSDRCCTTRMTVVTSVLIICLLIGAAVGVGMYFKYGRNDSNSSGDNSKNEAPSSENGAAPSDNDYHNCIWIDFDAIENAVDTIIGGGNKDSYGKDDDRHNDADKDDKEFSKSDEEKRNDDDEDKEFSKSDEEDEEKDNDEDDDDKDSSKNTPGKHDGHHDCFRGLDNGTFTLEGHPGFWIYNSQGKPEYQDNDGAPSWGWDDDDLFTWHGSDNNNLHLC